MRTLVVVTGAPASGKSTVAQALGVRLGLPVIAKDVIKEGLFDSLGTGDPAWSRRMSHAAYQVMFAVARALDEAVLEGNFRPEHGPRLVALCPIPLEVHCACPPAELALRWARRRRHPGHLDHLGPPPGDSPGPLVLAPHVLEVDTGGRLDMAAVAAWVSSRRA